MTAPYLDILCCFDHIRLNKSIKQNSIIITILLGHIILYHYSIGIYVLHTTLDLWLDIVDKELGILLEEYRQMIYHEK